MRYICIFLESIQALVTKLSCNHSDALKSMRLTFPLRAFRTCPFLIETLSAGSNSNHISPKKDLFVANRQIIINKILDFRDSGFRFEFLNLETIHKVGIFEF